MLLVNTAIDPSVAAPRLERELRGFHAELTLVNIEPYDRLVSGFLAGQRMNAELFTAVALIGLLLAAAGIYSVTNLAVNQRQRSDGHQARHGRSFTRTRARLAGRLRSDTAGGWFALRRRGDRSRHLCHRHRGALGHSIARRLPADAPRRPSRSNDIAAEPMRRVLPGREDGRWHGMQTRTAAGSCSSRFRRERKGRTRIPKAPTWCGLPLTGSRNCGRCWRAVGIVWPFAVPFHRQGCLCHSQAGSLFIRGERPASPSREPSVTQASLPVMPGLCRAWP